MAVLTESYDIPIALATQERTLLAKNFNLNCPVLIQLNDVGCMPTTSLITWGGNKWQQYVQLSPSPLFALDCDASVDMRSLIVFACMILYLYITHVSPV